MPKKSDVDIKVPKEAGESITMRRAGLEPVTYSVTNGKVSVSEAEADHFLVIVEGSTIVGGSPAGNQE